MVYATDFSFLLLTFDSAFLIMRIFYFNKDNESDPLTLLYNTSQTSELPIPSRSLNFPPEIVQRILTYLTRSIAGPKFSEVMQDTKVLLQQSREKLVIT